MSVDLEIGELQLMFEGIDYPDHRAAAISRMAISMLEEVIQQNLVQLGLAGERRMGAITAPAVNVDLDHTTEDQLARLVAQSIYAALVVQLRI